MDLFLVRHGEAEDKASGNGERGDGGRCLTERGVLQSVKVGEMLARIGEVPDLVFCSPLIRAQETATSLMRGAGIEGQPLSQNWLGLGLVPAEVLTELGALPIEVGKVVLVGHEPSFSGLTAWLLGAEVGYVEVKKASVVHLQLAPPSRHGTLLKMLLPVQVL